MKTYLECIPCFFRQALEAGIMAGADEIVRKKILDDVAFALPGFSLEASPPEMARIIHGIVKKHTGIEDPYKEIKRKSNITALGVYKRLKEKVKNSPDSLLGAIEVAIAGNIIDYGVKNTLNVDEEIDKILKDEDKAIKKEKDSCFEYKKFKDELEQASTIVYLGDNAGETVFDRVLMEEIKRIDENKNIYYVVKAKPIINDALAEDAKESGIDSCAEIISSGSDAPGTILSICDKGFIELYKQADMIISKGQGNFEALSEPGRSVFYLFMAKCSVIAKDVGCEIGDIILRYNT
ncbi:MAG: ARMT1-like domain-containing protein [Candidatus Aadella gelida]|nr:ARMT1-like domain-containing protein [Candidatus Aadella gelida]